MPKSKPQIKRARYDKLTIYEVSEDELDILERGAPDSLLLNFAIFCLSVCLSFVIALATALTGSNRVYYTFLNVALFAGLGGIVLIAIWARTRRNTKTIAKKIRERLPPEGKSIEIEIKQGLTLTEEIQAEVVHPSAPNSADE